MSYIFHLLIFLEIYILVAMSLNLLIGYSGLLQLAHAAFFGIGAYTVAIIATKIGISFFSTLALSGIIAAIISLLVSIPARRFRGDYFIMVSLAVQVMLYAVIYNWVGLTNGPYGISGIPKPAILGTVFDTNSRIFVLYTVVLVILATMLGIIKKSPFGRSLQAMRDDELAARSIGLPVRKLKLEAFIIASFIVGIAGAMYGFYVGFIDPESASLNESILMLSMVIVGGTGNLRGPIIGAIVLIALPEAMRFLQIPDNVAANIRLLAYGFLLIIIMLARPQGLAGKYRFE